MTRVQARHVAGREEWLTVAIEPIRTGVFAVTWQEEDKSTVVHIEDFDAGRYRWP